MIDLSGLPITFYGHFTGFSSYPVVSLAIAQWLVTRGADVRLCNLRTSPLPGHLAEYAVPDWYNAVVWNQAVRLGTATDMAPDREGSVGLVFGFPQWLPAIPRHRKMIGYHVGDVSPVQPSWKGLIERRCDLVLTPSSWSAGLLMDLEPTSESGRPLPIKVVPHGIDPEVFCLEAPGWSKEAPGSGIVLRHFCSSVMLERKGTLELLRAACQVFEEESLLPGGERATLVASVPREALPVALSLCGEYPSGSIGAFEDTPATRHSMARVLRKSAAVLQPSRAEGFGCIPLESVACGTPVLLLGATGEAEYVDDLGDAAVLVSPGGDLPCGGGGEAPSINQESLVDGLL
ncbi:glycosyltransferase, partial [Patescibacteria group bacterium]|nr:glycosyltransferase [Patescibacteria group bacterium]